MTNPVFPGGHHRIVLGFLFSQAFNTTITLDSQCHICWIFLAPTLGNLIIT